MNLLESLRVALTALVANKLRSLLTMLGVIIGVGAVIIMISIIQGARQKVVQDFQGNGADVVFAFYAPKRETQRGGRFEGLTRDDVVAIERRVTLADTVDARLEQNVRVARGAKTFTSTANGTNPRYPQTNAVKVLSGRFIADEDQEAWAKVCVLGDKVRSRLFSAHEEPLGQTVVVTNIGSGVKILCTVIGVLERKGNQGFGPTPDDQIFLPDTTLEKRLIGVARSVASLTIRSRPGTAEECANQVFAVLKDRHPQQAQDFIVDTQEGLLQRLDSVLMIFQLILGGVGGLSLLVGGIGIMNIMLVSVTERTREIGIRKAVGAKRSHILIQFITESITVSGVGGILGCGFGYFVSAMIGLAAKDKLPTYVPFWAAALGFGFAVGVGMFFGIYPAFRAAKLDPIQALRYE